MNPLIFSSKKPIYLGLLLFSNEYQKTFLTNINLLFPDSLESIKAMALSFQV